MNQITCMHDPEFSGKRRLLAYLAQVRPLLLWGLFVMVLFAIHKHQQLMERSQLRFSFRVNGKLAELKSLATLDGRAVVSGQRLTLGSHRLAISDPKIEPFSTNFFGWYGGYNLGNLELVRARGSLSIISKPVARFIHIRGPEFKLVLTNSAGGTLKVPTDEYELEAEYGHYHQTGKTTVFMNVPGQWECTPNLGGLLLGSRQPGATFKVLSAGGDIVEKGNLPSSLVDLPEDRYTVIAVHNRNQLVQTVPINRGETNKLELEFKYGSAVLDTEPQGATVSAQGGVNLGVTPCTIQEMIPGTWELQLRKNGYEPVDVSLVIGAEATNMFRTNLVSRDYRGAIESGKRSIETEQYDRAIEAAEDALKAQPNDQVATKLKTEATGLSKLHQGANLGQKQRYEEALAQVREALQLIPDNERARTLLGELKQSQAEEIEKTRLVRLNRPREVFSKQLALNVDAKLFETHELKSNRTVDEVSTAILAGLRHQAPVFTIGLSSKPFPDVSLIVAKQEASNQARICVIVVGQITDSETQILFEVLEYKVDVVGKILGAVLNAPLLNSQSKSKANQPDPHIPLHPSRVGTLTDKMKNQIEEGVHIITDIIPVKG